MSRDPGPVLVTGATGYVGSQLITELLRRDVSARALARDPARATLPAQVDARRGDAVSGAGLPEAKRFPLVLVRAAMIIGSGSASFVMLRYLAARLPSSPRWIETRTQPIAAVDVVRALADVASADDAPDEVQLGGADVLTYQAMMERTAELLGRRRPLILRVPVLTPRLSSHWVALGFDDAVRAALA